MGHAAVAGVVGDGRKPRMPVGIGFEELGKRTNFAKPNAPKIAHHFKIKVNDYVTPSSVFAPSIQSDTGNRETVGG
jgi:hypothetical protein